MRVAEIDADDCSVGLSERDEHGASHADRSVWFAHVAIDAGFSSVDENVSSSLSIASPLSTTEW